MKRFFLLFLTTLSLLACQASIAAGEKFNDAKFEAQISTGKPVVVVSHAPWCPTCRAQSAVLNDLFANDTYKSITYYVVDFDSQKEALKKFNISRQSTIVVFKEGKEVARSIGATSSSAIESQLNKGL
jgi:thioredoxin 1